MQIAMTLPVGIYEKALPGDLSWEERLTMAANAGYEFVEMSIDESEARMSRLTWSNGERKDLRQAIANSGVPIFTMCLSAHRKYPLGSADEDIRRHAWTIFKQAIDLAIDLGVKIIQVMGYDVFYEPSTDESQRRFLEGLQQGAHWASQAGVMLALENVDVEFVDSVEKAIHLIKQVNSPWLNIYPDMGNLVAAGYDPISQLNLAKGYLVGVHVKDATPGVVRGVRFGEGIVPLKGVFQTLAEIDFCGPLAVEMWAHMDAAGDPIKRAKEARVLVNNLVQGAWNG